MKKIIAAMAILLLVLTMVPGMSEGSKISIHVNGPTVIGTNQTVQYKVELQGFYDEYKCGVMLVGYNLTGASPTNEYVKSNNTGVFVFNITAPANPQTIYIYFNAYGMNNGTEGVEKVTRVLTVEVKKAVEIKVKLKNIEDYDVKNVKLDFYIDGMYVGNTTVDKIEANSTKLVTYFWIPQGLYEGKHTLEVKVSSNGVVLENGDRTFTSEFYYGEQPTYDYVKYLNLSLFLIVLAFFILFMLGRGGRKHAPAPKWKK